ncbi:DUF5710 domain-containing protein [Telluria beijingensis]|uniref:DUF5710 domain-containing protein n=1 Tax=Telluria beijingensis TaxID=3068633 RepID=UPI002795EC50|nr:DUF5710 domain-containing protein [Massilia sp. REN29]
MVFLTVPYAEKDAAKALGARWNPTRRRWYVPDGVATEPFAKWLDGAPDAAAPTAKPGRVDSYQGKTVVGLNYVELAHDCDPMQACPHCTQQLAGTPWAQAQAGLRALVGSMAGTSNK